MKCPGVSASISSVFSGSGASGRELRHASIWVLIVVSSSKLTLMSPTIHLMWNVKLLTAASNRPPKCGDCSGINFHCIL